jgi:transposase InsO family protein
MCPLLNVSKSGYDDWRKREPSQRKREDECLGKRMESFFGTLKEEYIERQTYQTRAEAKNSVFEYFEAFYNR